MASAGPKLFRCPKCRSSYLGHDPLPDCPHCGYDYRERTGFRWDLFVYLLVVVALLSFMLVTSYYRGLFGSRYADPVLDAADEKLPGSSITPIPDPYRRPGSDR